MALHALFMALVGAGCLTGCSLIPVAAGYVTSGGVSLYKNEKSSGPKLEVVIMKAEFNHNVIQPCPVAK